VTPERPSAPGLAVVSIEAAAFFDMSCGRGLDVVPSDPRPLRTAREARPAGAWAPTPARLLHVDTGGL